jgi:hypothetical protein
MEHPHLHHRPRLRSLTPIHQLTDPPTIRTRNIVQKPEA